MSEHISTGTTTQADPTPDHPRYRVRGSVLLWVSITAAGREEATGAIPAAVTEVFAGLPGAVLTPELLAIDTPQPFTSPDTDTQARYLVPVTVHGHLDVTAEDHLDALDVALNALAAHLSGRTDVVADLLSALCQDVTEIPTTQPTE